MTEGLSRTTVDPVPGLAHLPWRPTSLLYPAFFGGPLAAVVLGLLNGRRLGLPRPALVSIAGAGVAGLVARLLLMLALHEHGLAPILGAVTGAAVWVVVLRTQRERFRAYEQAGGEGDSLVRPGILAAVGCGLLEAIALGIILD